MNDIFNSLVLMLCDYYEENVDKNDFDGSSLIECEFIDNLRRKLDELNIKYDNSKLDFLAKGLLVRYNYDKICLLMTKKYIENPNKNNGRVSNLDVYDFCLSLENVDDDCLRDIKDKFYIKAGNFSIIEKASINNNLYRNEILEEKFGINNDVKNKFFNNYNRFSSCYKGTVEAIKLKKLGIKEYHQKLLNEKQKSYQYRKVING